MGKEWLLVQEDCSAGSRPFQVMAFARFPIPLSLRPQAHGELRTCLVQRPVQRVSGHQHHSSALETGQRRNLHGGRSQPHEDGV